MTRAPRPMSPRSSIPAVVTASLAFFFSACAAATQPADPGRPRANLAPYPVVLAASDERRAAALAAWPVVVGEQTAATSPTPELRPVTATLGALPAGLAAQPRLPLVVIKDEQQQSEEETRESLRRFIGTAAPLLGVEPRELSLVEITDAQEGGARRARYIQRPFPFPLRNGFGVVEVTFTPDLRVVGLNSTAIPDSETLRRALAAVTRQVTAERAVASLANRAVTYTDAGGNQQTRTVTQADTVTARELVVFPVRAEGDAATLALHLAWEVAVGDADAPLLVYVDAVTGEQLTAVREG